MYNVEVPLESWIDEGGEDETLALLTLVDFFVDSFGLFIEDADMGVASLVGLAVDLWEEGVEVTSLNLFLPLVSRVDLLRFGVCTVAAAAVALLVSLALASVLVAVEEEAAAEGGGVPEPAAAPPPPLDRVLAMDQ